VHETQQDGNTESNSKNQKKNEKHDFLEMNECMIVSWIEEEEEKPKQKHFDARNKINNESKIKKKNYKL
jgi:hypothetical protein